MDIPPPVPSTRSKTLSFSRRVLMIFIPLVIITLLGSIALFKLYIDSYKIEVQTREAEQVKTGTRSISHSLQLIYTDLIYIANNHDVSWGVLNREGHSLQHLSFNWLEFIQTKKLYDQVRFLDNDGYEKIRINYNKGEPYIVPQEQLKNKSNRYYFSSSIELNRNEFFISPLDLNIENKAIEIPLKPIIRIAMPVFDLKGTKLGIVILNYLGNNLFNYLNKMIGHNSKNIWMINADGYWLKGRSSDDEWGFMYNNAQKTMLNKFPHAWRKIQTNSSGQFYNDVGLWSYSTVYPEQIKPTANSFTVKINQPIQQYWKVVLLSPKDKFNRYSMNVLIILLISTFILLVIFSVGAVRLVKAWTAQENTQNKLQQLNESLEDLVSKRTHKLNEAVQRAEKLAQTDFLTGLNNRRAFFEQANKLVKLAKRYGHKYTIIMIDLDRFKLINDNYGHAMGDKVIIKLARTINDIIRSTDIAGRIGGEEFAIILPETESSEAKELAERLRCKVDSIILTNGKGTLAFTASLGLAESAPNDSSFNDTLSRADIALYKAKEQGRNCVVIL